ncbi:MAG: methylmalonyl Co-A mutase-associated GTPase MeaB [Salibacteraceae bacterium]
MATNKSFKIKRKDSVNFESLQSGIKNGDISALAKAITLTESKLFEHNKLANRLVSTNSEPSFKSLRIGITGVPGVGKSTFIESFGKLVTEQGKKLAVLAIDPTSQQTGGSILGDKTRMESLSKNADIFIRPSPAGNALGGVARTTRESIILCEAAGYNIILVETVGVGQSETEVHSMVDFFMLLLLAGAGDELQGIKRGIMEMADLVIINKADGKNVQKAKLAKNFIDSALHYFPAKSSGWRVPTIISSALENKGIEEIWETCLRFENEMIESGNLQSRRKKQNLHWFHQSLNNHLTQRILNKPDVKSLIRDKELEIESGLISPFQASDQVAELFI